MFKKVAVTGGLSCGKSSVCHLFQELGAYTVSADEIVHRLLTPDTVLGQKVISLIGPTSVSNHKIDRNIIAMNVFQNPSQLKALEAILHPVVSEEMERLYQECVKTRSHPLFVAEIPLLFEAGMQDDFDAVIAVYADPETCKQRFMAQGHSAEDFENRARRQLPTEEKASRADYIIYNTNNMEETRQQVKTLFSTLTTS